MYRGLGHARSPGDDFGAFFGYDIFLTILHAYMNQRLGFCKSCFFSAYNAMLQFSHFDPLFPNDVPIMPEIFITKKWTIQKKISRVIPMFRHSPPYC